MWASVPQALLPVRSHFKASDAADSRKQLCHCPITLAIGWFLPSNIRAKMARGRSSSMLSESSGTIRRPSIVVIPAREAFVSEIQGLDLRTVDNDDFST